MNVSIIIPCHNESQVLNDKILNTLELGKNVKEIIIIDDYSEDGTYKIAKKLAKKNKKINVIKNSYSNGKNFAVKCAIENCSGELICMTDADVLLPSDAIEKALPYFKKKSVGMICLSTKLISDEKKRYSAIYETFVRAIKIFESKIDSVTAPHAQALFFRKSLNTFPTRQADDVDMAIQTRKKGYKVKYVSNCFFEEKVIEGNKLKKQKIRRCKAVIDSLWYHKNVFLNLKYGLFGILCYPLDLIIYMLSPFIILFIVLSILIFFMLFYGFIATLVFIAILEWIFLFTKFRTITKLSIINFLAIKEYFKEGPSKQWNPPRIK